MQANDRTESQSCPNAAPAGQGNAQDVPKHPHLTLRPYQLLCAVCSLGEYPGGCEDEKLAAILEQVRQTPDMPITLKCDVHEAFGFQSPGPPDDDPRRADFNKARDMEILVRMNEPPGVTLSARILFNRLLNTITTVRGICDGAPGASDAWKGCPKASCGYYEKAREMQRSLVLQSWEERAKSGACEDALRKGLAVLIHPRSVEDLERSKKESLEAMYAAKSTGIAIRPHTLLCAICQYGAGTRPPYPDDNLPDLIQLILKEPDTLLTMAEGAPWTICGPCAAWCREMNGCVQVNGSGGLTSHLRDLRTLRILDLTFGSTIAAKKLYQRILERIPSTLATCHWGDPQPSVWWDCCTARKTNNEDYEKGRQALLKEFA